MNGPGDESCALAGYGSRPARAVHRAGCTPTQANRLVTTLRPVQLQAAERPGAWLPAFTERGAPHWRDAARVGRSGNEAPRTEGTACAKTACPADPAD